MNQDEIITFRSPESSANIPSTQEPPPELLEITSSVAHDLQAPLKSLTKFTELLSKEYQEELDGPGQQYLQEISSSSNRMQTLVNDLLVYSEAATGNQTWLLVDLQETLETVCGNLQPLIEQIQAEIIVDPLPQLLINPQEIQQLFYNLVDNALKYCGIPQPEIRISATAQHGTWLFAVQDQGIGIAPEFQAQIFELFCRLNPASPGSGLGLAICRKILHRYGGRIWVESNLGSGSTFYFTLPQDINPQVESARIE